MTIDIRQLQPLPNGKCYVTVRGDGRASYYTVSVSQEAYETLTGGRVPLEALVRAAFEFLLERESQAAIMPVFDILTPQRYFGDYTRALQNALP